jgi:Uma2 family endonuclease
MATVASLPATDQQRFRLSGVTWDQYEGILQLFEGRHLRITYDHGELELMTVSPEHERAKKVLARMLETLTEELDIPIAGLGNTTFRREDLERGLEPDECWYIAHEEVMRHCMRIDLSIDPPPDLVIEVEITRSLLNRVRIYENLGVSEIWRCDGQTVRICRLEATAEYAEVAESPTFPGLKAADLTRFVVERETTDETRLVKRFRSWVRENLVGREESNE